MSHFVMKFGPHSYLKPQIFPTDSAVLLCSVLICVGVQTVLRHQRLKPTLASVSDYHVFESLAANLEARFSC